VTEAVTSGALPATRVEAWRALDREAQSSPRAMPTYEQRRKDREFAKLVKAVQRRKGRTE
jgi:hypothetical protein